MSEEENIIESDESKVAVPEGKQARNSSHRNQRRICSKQSLKMILQLSKLQKRHQKKKEETAADLLGANIEQVKVRKAKGSKNISSGICFIVATFKQYKSVLFRYERKYYILVKLWEVQLPWFTKINCLCCTSCDSRRWSCCYVSRHERGLGEGKRARYGQRFRHTSFAKLRLYGFNDHRCNTCSTQWLSSA